jgi:hypothetical protein
MPLRRSTASSLGGPAGFFAPVAFGAVLLGGLTLLRAVVVVPLALLAGRGASAGTAVAAVALAAGAGAFGGLAYAVVGRPLRRVPWVGPYAAGVVTAAAYLGAALWAIGRIEPGAGMSLAKSADRFALVVTSLIFGVVLGRQFVKDDEEDARAPHVAT